jgi:hypothetical protein
MRTNYILIDYENVQPGSLAAVEVEHVRVLVFVGASQSKIAFETANAVQRFGAHAEYVKIVGNGPNALDFHIAFHIGHLAAKDPSAFFHIISKDTGFDPLIQHLKDRKIFASRSKDVADIPLVKAANSATTSEKIDVVLANFRQRGTSKPRTLTTLSSTIHSLFQKRLTEKELAALLQGLQDKGFVTVDDTKVSYALPAEPGGAAP